MAKASAKTDKALKKKKKEIAKRGDEMKAAQQAHAEGQKRAAKDRNTTMMMMEGDIKADMIQQMEHKLFSAAFCLLYVIFSKRVYYCAARAVLQWSCKGDAA